MVKQYVRGMVCAACVLLLLAALGQPVAARPLDGAAAGGRSIHSGMLPSGSANHAPVLNTAGAPALAAIDEDSAANVGTTVDAIIASVLPLVLIADEDAGAQRGLAIVGADGADGAWQLSLDGGATWAALGAVSDASARLLAADGLTRVRFVPRQNFDGTLDPAISLRAWDRTSGVNGGFADASRHGGSSAFSDRVETASLTVRPSNDPPVAASDTAVTPAGTPRLIYVLGNDADPDGDPLALTALEPPAHGSASASGATATYTPTDGFAGTDVFTYTVSDGLLADSACVTVTVGMPNQPPVAVDDASTTPVNLPASLAVLYNDRDPDGDTLAVTAVGVPAHGQAELRGAAIVYTPTLNFAGSDSFTYSVSDGAASATGVVTMSVVPAGASPWEEDHFDDLALGPLAGQNGWLLPARDRAAPLVAAEDGGRLLRIDPAPGEIMAVEKDVPDQSSGSHTFVMRVKLVDASAAATGPLAKVEVRTSPGAGGWGKKFEIAIGSSIGVTYSARGAGKLLVAQTESGRWYNIRGRLDLAREKLKLWVDGKLAADDISLTKGPITSLAIAGWDQPGALLIDDVAGLVSDPSDDGSGTYWISSRGGLWDTPAYWSGGKTPDSASHAFVTLQGSYMVAVRQDAAAGSLTIGGTSGTPTVAIGGSSQASGVGLAVKGKLYNAGVIRLESVGGAYGASLSARDLLTNAGTIAVVQGGGGARAIAGKLLNRGTLQVGWPLAFAGELTNDGAITIAAGQRLSLSGDGQVFNQRSGAIGGDGWLELSGGATLNFDKGTTNMAAPPRLTNAALAFGAGASGKAGFVLRGASRLKGDVGAEQTVWLRGESQLPAAVHAPAGLGNAGSIYLESQGGAYAAGLTLEAGELTNTGTISVTQASGGARALAGKLLNRGLVAVRWPLAFSGSFTNAKTLSIAAGQQLSLSGDGQVFNQRSGAIGGDGWLELSGGATLNFDKGTTNMAAPPELDGATLVFGRNASGRAGFVLRGASRLKGDVGAEQTVWLRSDATSQASVTAPASFTNAGEIRLESAGGARGASLTVRGRLTNAGTLISAHGASAAHALAGDLLNQGRIDVDHDLAQTGAFSNTGVLSVSLGPGKSASDKLDVTRAWLAGELLLNQAPGFNPPLGRRYTLLAFESRDGEFGRVEGRRLGGDKCLDVAYGPLDVTATVVSCADAPIAGLAATSDGPTVLGYATILTATVAQGSNLAYAWDFGDGSVGGGAVASHSYPAIGTYVATVTATNLVSHASAATSVVVTPAAVLRATVDLQGRPARPDRSWSIPLTITLTPRGAAAPRYTLRATADRYGALVLGDLAPGVYDIRVKGAHTLRNLLRDVSLAPGENQRSLGWLVEGDAETAASPNQVTGADLALLASAINRCADDAGFVANADLDESGCVTVADFGLLSGNYGRQGDVPAQIGGLPIDPGGQPLLAIEPARISAEKGQVVSVAVVLDPRGALASGAMVHLRFDPASVEVVSARLGSQLTTVLQPPLVDNQHGDVLLGAGLLARAIGEKITVATLSLRLRSEAAPATLTPAADSFPASQAVWSQGGIPVEARGLTLTPLKYRSYAALVVR